MILNISADYIAERATGELKHEILRTSAEFEGRLFTLAGSKISTPSLFPSCHSQTRNTKMSYDDVEIEDMEWNDELEAYTYPCPCGDLFQITKEELKIGEEIARCPSCSLFITVIYNMEDFAADNSKNNKQPPQQRPISVA